MGKSSPTSILLSTMQQGCSQSWAVLGDCVRYVSEITGVNYLGNRCHFPVFPKNFSGVNVNIHLGKKSGLHFSWVSRSLLIFPTWVSLEKRLPIGLCKHYFWASKRMAFALLIGKRIYLAFSFCGFIISLNILDFSYLLFILA